mgnify:CR=1 FL=1
MKRVLALLLVLMLVAVVSCKKEEKVVKVAILAPLSGPVPTFGVSTRDGALLAVEEWNAKGGVNGKKIVPIVEDIAENGRESFRRDLALRRGVYLYSGHCTHEGLAGLLVCEYSSLDALLRR